MSRPAWAEPEPKFTNTHVVGTQVELIRIVFGEGVGTEDSNRFHTAVIMGRTDAKLLAEGILRALSQESAALSAPPGKAN